MYNDIGLKEFVLDYSCIINFAKSELSEDGSDFVIRRNMENMTEYILQLIERDELWRFYKTKEWRSLKRRILTEHHYECAECRRLGRITRYDRDKDGRRRLISAVHHVKHVRNHPELALSRTYTDMDGVHDNLIPVCKSCHNKLHPEKHRQAVAKDRFVNVERW